MTKRILQYLSVYAKKQVVQGIVIILSFFIITLVFNVTYLLLQDSLKPNLPVGTNDRLVIEIGYKKDVVKYQYDEKQKRAIPDYKPIHDEVQREVGHVRGVEISSFAEKPIDIAISMAGDLGNDKERGFICDSDFGQVFDFKLEQGRWFSDSDMEEDFPPVVITRLHANILGIDKLADPTYFQFKSGKYDLKFKVVGIMQDIGRISDYDHDPIPFFAPYKISGNTYVRFDYQFVKISRGENQDEIKEKIEKLYKSKGWDNKFYKFQVSTLDDLMHQKFIGHLSMFSIEYGIVVMLLCFIAVILFGSSWRQTNSRVQEIGIRRSVGASRRAVIWLVICEKLIFFILTMIVALIIYLNIYQIFQINYFVILPVISFSLIFLVIVVSTLIPAIRASKINPVEALAEE